jgi:DNA-binding beta-propeller fold protein YncE
MKKSRFAPIAFTPMVAFAVFIALPARAAAPAAGLYVVDSADDSVLRYDGATGAPLGTFIPSHGGGLTTGQDIVVGPDGNFYVSSWSTSSVKRYDGQTSAFLGDFVAAGAGGLINPDQIAFGPDGNLYVSDRFPGRILKYDGATGAPLGLLVGDPRLSGFVAFAFGPDKNVYASMFNGQQCVLKFDGTTGADLGEVACAPDISSAFAGLAFGPDGTLYASRYHEGAVWKIDPATGTHSTMSCPGNTRSDKMAFGPDGKLYVSNLLSGVDRFDPATGACLGTFLASPPFQNSGLTFVAPAAPPNHSCHEKEKDDRDDDRHGNAHREHANRHHRRPSHREEKRGHGR